MPWRRSEIPCRWIRFGCGRGSVVLGSSSGDFIILIYSNKDGKELADHIE